MTYDNVVECTSLNLNQMIVILVQWNMHIDFILIFVKFSFLIKL